MVSVRALVMSLGQIQRCSHTRYTTFNAVEKKSCMNLLGIEAPVCYRHEHNSSTCSISFDLIFSLVCSNKFIVTHMLSSIGITVRLDFLFVIIKRIYASLILVMGIGPHF